MEIEFKVKRKVINMFKRAVYAMRLHGYDAYLGGGALRDLYAGRKLRDIKDFDIFLVPKQDLQEIDISRSHLKHCTILSGDAIPDMKKRGVTHLIWWYKNGTEYNFIVYGKHLSPEELAYDMDFGICQAMYPLSSAIERRHAIIVSDNFMNDFNEGVIQCYHKYNKRRMRDRYERMEQKFPTFISRGKPKCKLRGKNGKRKKMKVHY